MKRCSVTKNQLELGIKQNQFLILTQQTMRIPHNNFIFQNGNTIFMVFCKTKIESSYIRIFNSYSTDDKVPSQQFHFPKWRCYFHYILKLFSQFGHALTAMGKAGRHKVRECKSQHCLQGG